MKTAALPALHTAMNWPSAMADSDEWSSRALSSTWMQIFVRISPIFLSTIDLDEPLCTLAHIVNPCPNGFQKIGQCQINRHEKCFDLMCILEKVNESLLRYGNPDMLILGTLKIKFLISSF